MPRACGPLNTYSSPSASANQPALRTRLGNLVREAHCGAPALCRDSPPPGTVSRPFGLWHVLSGDEQHGVGAVGLATLTRPLSRDPPERELCAGPGGGSREQPPRPPWAV